MLNSLTNSEVTTFGVSPPCRTFVGREAELSELKEHFKQQVEGVVVCAMGGQGKTQLCRKFVQQLQEDNPSQLVTWFRGDTASDLFTSIIDFANELGLATSNSSGNPLPINEIIKNLERKLKPNQNKSWLIVMDNVDEDYPEFVQVAQQLFSMKSFVLVSTRRTNVFAGDLPQLELQQLADKDANELVHNQIKDAKEEDIKLLCGTLGNHALALQAAVSYIRARKASSLKGKGYGISDYIMEFEQDKIELLMHELKVPKYDETIYLVVNKTLKLIKERNELVGQSTGNGCTLPGKARWD